MALYLFPLTTKGKKIFYFLRPLMYFVVAGSRLIGGMMTTGCASSNPHAMKKDSMEKEKGSMAKEEGGMMKEPGNMAKE